MEQSKPFVHIKEAFYTIWKVKFLADFIFWLAWGFPVDFFCLEFFFFQPAVGPVSSHVGDLEQGWFVQLLFWKATDFSKD